MPYCHRMLLARTRRILTTEQVRIERRAAKRDYRPRKFTARQLAIAVAALEKQEREAA